MLPRVFLFLCGAMVAWAQPAPAPVYEIFTPQFRGTITNVPSNGIRQRGGAELVPLGTYWDIVKLNDTLFAFTHIVTQKKKPTIQSGWGVYDAAQRREIVAPDNLGVALLKTGRLLVLNASGKLVFHDLTGRETGARHYDVGYQRKLTPELVRAIEQVPIRFSFKEGRVFVFGFIDAHGREWLLPQYDAVDHLRGGLSVVTKNKVHGLIDSTGREIVAPQYKFMRAYGNGVVAFSTVGEYDKKANIIGGKWGFMNPRGEVLGRTRFDDVASYPFWPDGPEEDSIINAKLGNRWVGVKALQRNPDGELVLTWPALIPHGEKTSNGQLWGIEVHGHLVMLKPRYTSMSPFKNGYAIVSSPSATEQTLDTYGKKVPVPLYGVIDSTGREVIPPRYKAARMGDQQDEFIMAEGPGDKEHAWRQLIVDADGRVARDTPYQRISSLIGDRRLVMRSGQYGYVDADWNEVIPPRFPDAQDFSEGLAAVSGRDNKWYWIDPSGVFALGGDYLYAGGFKNGRAWAAINRDKWGRLGDGVYIDRQGKVVGHSGPLPPPPPREFKCWTCNGTGGRYDVQRKEYSVTEIDRHSALAPGGRVEYTRSGSYLKAQRVGDCWDCGGKGVLVR